MPRHLRDAQADVRAADDAPDPEGLLDLEQLGFFLKRNLSLEKGKDKLPADFMSDAGSHDKQRLRNMNDRKFAKLPDDIKANAEQWKT